MQNQQFGLISLISTAIRAYHAAYDGSSIFVDTLAPSLLAAVKSPAQPGTLLTALEQLEPDFVKAYSRRYGSLPWWLRVIAGTILSQAR